MKQQIKKLCKQLSRFNFDEIASILEQGDDELQKIIQELITEKVISKISDTEFAYVPDIVPYPQVETLPQKPSPKQTKPELCFDITTLLSDNKEAQKLFENAAEYNKRHIIKCLNKTPNDIRKLLKKYPNIQAICLNGNKSYSAFKKYFSDLLVKYTCHKLPSTSPANAKYKLIDLFQEWNTALNIFYFK